MPRHLISDAHEWINEIAIYYLAKPQPRQRAWENQRGKKTLAGKEGDDDWAQAGVSVVGVFVLRLVVKKKLTINASCRYS
ncbi:unnamed protein product, partial [Brenthis ino]